MEGSHPYDGNMSQNSHDNDTPFTPQVSFRFPNVPFPNPKIPYTPPVADETYHVPTRFGMSGLLAITTLMGVVFGILRNFTGGLNFHFDPYEETHPIAYLFLALLALATCLAQMRYGGVPRAASCAAGAILFPLCICATVLFQWGFWVFLQTLCALPLLVIGGAGFGYLAGACTAGCFLLMDSFDTWYARRIQRITPTSPAPNSAEPILAELVDSPGNEKRES